MKLIYIYHQLEGIQNENNNNNICIDLKQCISLM